MPGVAEQLERVVNQLPHGQVRTGQLAMAEAVARCLSGDVSGEGPPRHVAVTAGTGTGKSFAYLVPAVLSGRRVVVATATKALQDQLATKDLPLVAEALGRKRPIRWAVLKGRSNYLCRQRIAEMAEGRQESFEGVGESRLGRQVARLVEWADTTFSGDRAELDFEPHPTAWSAVSVGAQECPGAHRCPSGADCFTERARAVAAAADVAVVNLHLLGADLRSGGAVLPEHEALIVDEAHELEDVLAACLGVDVGAGRLRALAAAARSALGEGRRRRRAGRAGRASKGGRGVRQSEPSGAEPSGAEPSGEDVSEAAEGVMAAALRFERALDTAQGKRLPPGLGAEIGAAVALTVNRLMRLETELRRTGEGGEPAPAALRALLAVERCREELESCLRPEEDEVVWVSDRPALRSAPLDVGPFLAAQVFGQMPVVLTSATLPPGLGGRLGAEPGSVTEMNVGSPFDYAGNGLIYCATRLPDRRRPEAEEALHDELETLVRAAGGRTLGLFTSYRAMEAAAAALRKRIPWPVHVQGDLPKPALLRAFSEEDAACLFATMGFWQGVDVPGPTLSLVVIDRLPFPRPDEPLVAARREAAGEAGFRRVDLPRAATLLAQGAGRLIRAESDRGVVAVLDPRLATASYSGYLVKALPPMRRTKSLSDAVAFLEAMASRTASSSQTSS